MTLEAAEIGQRLRELRERRGLKLWKVAQNAGMSSENYRHYESGRNKLAAIDLPRFALALGIETAYLVRYLGITGESAVDDGSLPEDEFRRRFAEEYGSEVSVEFQRLYDSVDVGPKTRAMIASLLRAMRESSEMDAALP